MNIQISKNVTKSDLQDIFGGEIPDCHPHDYIQSRLNDDFAFIAKQDDKPIGFLIYTIWWGNCPFIELIKVKEEHQNKGTGTALLKAAAKEIKSKNFKTLISSSEIINELGQNFHTHCKFEKLNTLNLPHGEEQFYSIELETI